MRKIAEDFPGHAARADALLREYERRRAEFEPAYRALPRASFQADMNISNLLFDGNGGFVGLMDFNLAGTDAVVAYAIYESFYYMTGEEIRNAVLNGDTAALDARLQRNLGYVAEEYGFSGAERAAFGTLFNLSAPFWGSNFEMYGELLLESGGEAAAPILDFIEREMTRAVALPAGD
jgi:hypothetical protein